MNEKPKIIALYLPQYHEIEENNKWWGEGHTEWTNCKSSKALKKNHYQPRIPENNNYYNLLDSHVQVWQAELAKEHGVYGFCYYHYWFEGKTLLEKPAENMLINTKIDIPFCFSWANHHWENKIQRKNRQMLKEQTYGSKEDWLKHFNYLLPFFKDSRYIRVNNKPMFIIYNIAHLRVWEDMRDYWLELACLNGLDGIYFVNTLKDEIDSHYTLEYGFDAQFEYQPALSMSRRTKLDYSWYIYLKRVLFKDFLGLPSTFKYDKIVSRSYTLTPENSVKTYLGLFTDWDITARWKKRGMFLKGSNPEKFGSYLKKQIQRNKEKYKSEFIFITAWNEWSEGAYLEPDEKYGSEYLKEIKKHIIGENNKQVNSK